MSDSLDLLLTRQPSAGRRAILPMNNSGMNSSRGSNMNNCYSSQYDSKESYARSGGYGYEKQQPMMQQQQAPIPALRMPSYSKEQQSYSDAKSPSYQSSPPPSQYPSSSSSTLGQSLAQSLTTKLSENNTPVNWSALKTKRGGSAHTVAPASSVPTPAVTHPAVARYGSASPSLTIAPTQTVPAVQQQQAAKPPLAAATSGRPTPITAVTSSNASSLKSPPSATSATSPGDGSVARPVQTFECPDCRRRFKRGSLMKHQKICAKVFGQQGKREKFDTAKIRTAGLEIQYEDATQEEEDACEGEPDEDGRPRTSAGMRPMTSAGKSSMKKDPEETKENTSQPGAWKDQSESLREAMRRAKKMKGSGMATSKSMGIDMRAMMPKQK